MIKNRIKNCFSNLIKNEKSALIAFMTAGDPDYTTSLKLINAMPKAGVDIIELGMPFSDPMADGPIIQRSYIRALKSGSSLLKTLDLVKNFRENNQYTPIILMGYFNPIYQMGVKKFFKKAKSFGVDGILIVDLPPESINELSKEFLENSVDLIRLVTPTSSKNRIKKISELASGFLYYVSITGITGSNITKLSNIKKSYISLKKNIKLPFVVGFGINSIEKAKEISSYSDGVVVGSDLVKEIELGIKNNGNIYNNVIKLVKKYSKAIKENKK